MARAGALPRPARGRPRRMPSLTPLFSAASLLKSVVSGPLRWLVRPELVSGARPARALPPPDAVRWKFREMWLDTDDDRESCVEDALSTVQLLPPGAIVIARGERWRVHACLGHADCAEIHLANAARSTVLLAPIDRFRLVESESRVRAVRLRQWAAWLREYATRYRAEGLRVDHVRARVLPYQLAPALAAAAGHARLLLADEVGLGKTIQAGWIVADAIGRNADARILIVVPAGLKRQWHAELLLHFGIDALVSDARWLRRTATELPGDINPWSLPGVYLTSLDFIKRSDVVRSLDHHVWDVLAVDEVHTAASPTDRFRALRVLARRARCVVMISATPFSGDLQSLASIAGLGAAPDDRPPLMFRRSREDAAVTGRRRHRFGVVTISRAERRVQRLLERYSRLVWRHAPGDSDAARLAMTVLRKRALSSPIAALRSLDRRLRFLESASADAGPVDTVRHRRGSIGRRGTGGSVGDSWNARPRSRTAMARRAHRCGSIRIAVRFEALVSSAPDAARARTTRPSSSPSIATP